MIGKCLHVLLCFITADRWPLAETPNSLRSWSLSPFPSISFTFKQLHLQQLSRNCAGVRVQLFRTVISILRRISLLTPEWPWKNVLWGWMHRDLLRFSFICISIICICMSLPCETMSYLGCAFSPEAFCREMFSYLVGHICILHLSECQQYFLLL